MRERERETQKLREKAVRGEERSIQSAWGSGQAQKLLARIKDESGWRGNIPEEKGIKEGGTKASAGGRTCVCFKAQWAGRRRAVLSHWPVRESLCGGLGSFSVPQPVLSGALKWSTSGMKSYLWKKWKKGLYIIPLPQVNCFLGEIWHLPYCRTFDVWGRNFVCQKRRCSWVQRC